MVSRDDALLPRQTARVGVVGAQVTEVADTFVDPDQVGEVASRFVAVWSRGAGYVGRR